MIIRKNAVNCLKQIGVSTVIQIQEMQYNAVKIYCSAYDVDWVI